MADLSPEKKKVLRDRTIAKVLWGEHEKLTIEFLREQGLGGPEIGELMDEARRERDRIVKRRLVWRFMFMVFGLIIFIGIPVFYYLNPELLESVRAKMVVSVAIVAGCACLVSAVKTLAALVSGKAEGAAYQD